MAKAPPLLFGWFAWFLIFSSFIILLGGVSAGQRFCSRGAYNSLVAGGGGSGYFAPISCDKFWRYSWFTLWYQFVMMIIVAAVLAMGKVHTWRYGLVFLLVPITYLLMDTANSTYLLQEQAISDLGAVRAVLAGAIIGSIANFMSIIVFGVRDENERTRDMAHT